MPVGKRHTGSGDAGNAALLSYTVVRVEASASGMATHREDCAAGAEPNCVAVVRRGGPYHGDDGTCGNEPERHHFDTRTCRVDYAETNTDNSARSCGAFATSIRGHASADIRGEQSCSSHRATDLQQKRSALQWPNSTLVITCFTLTSGSAPEASCR
ncbi:unnamed protein product [Phytophthora fragariaefolia]|uniref:Unnamed protein product n=1 Tax=Phytophthora fragariaefolia TaxID=1490495 RepID=A0A9W7CZG5_9STRA|nr:unnamed protein product [Phytophthora fragariaefolia]